MKQSSSLKKSGKKVAQARSEFSGILGVRVFPEAEMTFLGGVFEALRRYPNLVVTVEGWLGKRRLKLQFFGKCRFEAKIRTPSLTVDDIRGIEKYCGSAIF